MKLDARDGKTILMLLHDGWPRGSQVEGQAMRRARSYPHSEPVHVKRHACHLTKRDILDLRNEP